MNISKGAICSNIHTIEYFMFHILVYEKAKHDAVRFLPFYTIKFIYFSFIIYIQDI